MPDPTPQDIKNADYRARIAAEQRQAYGRVLRLAMGLFGLGWYPRGRHYLVEHEEEERARREGGKPQAAATVYTVSNGASQRHFALVDGKPVEFPSWEAAFGDALNEKHPTRGFMHNGEFCRTAKYSLCWAGYDAEYAPKTAEELAEARVKRVARKAEREEKRWAEENPLLDWASKQEGEGREGGAGR